MLRRFWSGWNQALILVQPDTHLALCKGTPAGREAEKTAVVGQNVVSMPRLGGLHHRYNLAA